MDNQLSYRQARSIRNRSVSDLIADELIREGKADGSQAVRQLGITEHEKIGATNGGISGMLTNGRLPREDFTKYSIMMALIQLEKPELYS